LFAVFRTKSKYERQLPEKYSGDDSAAVFASEEFFYGKIRNEHTRRAYLAAVRRFLAWAGESYVNTLMVQQVLNEPEWRKRMTAADWRGLTPLFFTHINLVGARPIRP
jgi:hypothetical protein